MKLIFWLNSVKPHLIPDALVAAITEDLTQRWGQPVAGEKDKAGELFRLDLGGPMMVDAEWVGVDIEGTNFEVPVRDIERFYLELLRGPLMTSGGQQYYKVRGWLHCVVLTADQRQTLLAAWGDRLQEYLDKASDEAEEYGRRVAELNRHPNIQFAVPVTAKVDGKDIN